MLGPEALAQDELAVSVPSPQIDPSRLTLLEDVMRDAGYGSAAALPVRSGRRDVGLLLAADLRPRRYGEAERMLLEVVAQRLAPLLGRMARQWSATGGHCAAGRRGSRRWWTRWRTPARMPARRSSISPS